MLAAALVLALGSHAASAQLSNPDLLVPPGKSSVRCIWSPFDGKPVSSPPYEKAITYQIPGGPYGMDGAIEGISLVEPPTAHRLKFSVALRASAADQSYSIVVVGVGTKGKALLPWTSEWELKGGLSVASWTVVEREICLPNETNRLRIVIHNPNKEPIYLSSPHLLVGESAEPDKDAIALAKKEIALAEAERAHPSASPAQKAADAIASSSGPVVAHIQIRAPICSKKPGERGVATFPVPALGKGQVPLAFKIECKAPGKLHGYSWRGRKDGTNLVCDVKLLPGVKGSWVQYDALVLVGGDRQRDTKPPVSTSGWERSTACVQSNAPQIKAIEKKLYSPNDTVESYARKVFAFVRDDMGKGAPFKALDALAALQCGGSCTNKANLSAALLRAHGIPARTVAHMPTWCSSKLYEHWLTEYWQPGTGWVAIDSALGRWDPDRRSRVVLAVSNPADEDLAFDPLHERFVMPGAAYLSVLELNPTLYPADLTDDDAINSVDQFAQLRISGREEATLFEAGTRSFREWLPRLGNRTEDETRYRRVMGAAKRCSPSALLNAIKVSPEHQLHRPTSH